MADPNANSERPRSAIVVGASSGIGAALVRELAGGGWRVGAVARREPELRALEQEFEAGRVIGYPHDVRNVGEAAPLFDRAAAELGGLDAIFYTAGVMPSVREDEYNSNKDRDILDINCLGAAAWLNCAAPYFERK